MQRRAESSADEVIEIAERDWLTCGLLWIATGMLAVIPLGGISRIGRVLFVLMLSVHTLEAIYVAIRACTSGLNVRKWFLRGIVIGALAVIKLEVHLRELPVRKPVR
jgi:VIT1/CCC1 family predicted Fe2+/Mn2+ transporter